MTILNEKTIKELVEEHGCKIEFHPTNSTNYSRGFITNQDNVQFGKVTMINGIYSHTKWYGGGSPIGFINHFHIVVDRITLENAAADEIERNRLQCIADLERSNTQEAVKQSKFKIFTSNLKLKLEQILNDLYNYLVK